MMEKKLPENWIETSIGTLAVRIQYGYTAKSVKNNKGIRYLRITDIQLGKVDWNNVPTCEINEDNIKKFSLKTNDIVFARTGATVGKSFLIEEIPVKSVFASYLIRLTVAPKVSPKLIKYFFNSSSYWNQISKSSTGIGQPNVNATKLGALKIPLPPLPEQKRIVAKLEELFGHLEILKKGLARIPDLLSDFRQSVLTQAVTGKLTNCVVNENVLGDLLESVKYGTSKKSQYDIEGIPVLRIPNLKKGKIDTRDLKYSKLEEKEYQSTRLRKGDVLIIRSNGSLSLVGQSSIVGGNNEGYSYAGYLIRLRVGNKLLPKYLNYSLGSNLLRAQIVETARSTSGVNNINSKEIQNLKVLVPTIEQQQEIVRCIESLFAKVDAIEARYQSLKAKVEDLPQAILAKAFRGELVPQLAEDGDARELLAQMQAVKEALDAKKKRRGK